MNPEVYCEPFNMQVTMESIYIAWFSDSQKPWLNSDWHSWIYAANFENSSSEQSAFAHSNLGNSSYVLQYVQEVVTHLYSNLLYKMGPDFLDIQYLASLLIFIIRN